MANAKSRRGPGLLAAALLFVAAIAGALWVSPWGVRLRSDAAAGTAYGARVACSCRFVAGRSLEDCRKDRLAGMGLIRFSEDADARSVTASVPLIASDTARLREGYGCVLESWRERNR